MKISVWDTYVEREDGTTMHFDILVSSDTEDAEVIFGFGRHYLKTKPFKTEGLSSKECRFCHIEHATDDIMEAVKQHGYAIIEMENC